MNPVACDWKDSLAATSRLSFQLQERFPTAFPQLLHDFFKFSCHDMLNRFGDAPRADKEKARTNAMKRLLVSLAAVAAMAAVIVPAVLAAPVDQAAPGPGWGWVCPAWGYGYGSGAQANIDYSQIPTWKTLGNKLGMNPNDLVKELQGGKSVTDVASEKNVSEQTLIDALMAPQIDFLKLQDETQVCDTWSGGGAGPGGSGGRDGLRPGAGWFRVWPHGWRIRLRPRWVRCGPRHDGWLLRRERLLRYAAPGSQRFPGLLWSRQGHGSRYDGRFLGGLSGSLGQRFQTRRAKGTRLVVDRRLVPLMPERLIQPCPSARIHTLRSGQSCPQPGNLSSRVVQLPPCRSRKP